MPQTVELNVLVVDDSFTYRQILSRVVGDIPGAKVIGQGTDGHDALKKVEELSPDLVLLDVTMPGMDGLETLRKIKRKYPKVDAIMVSGISSDQARTTMEALSLGALDFVTKPDSTSSKDSLSTLTRELTPLFIIARKNKRLRLVREEDTASRSQAPTSAPAPSTEPPRSVSPRTGVLPRPVERPVPPRRQQPLVQPKQPVVSAVPRRSPARMKFDVVALGVSTGGPQALQHVIPRLQPNFPLPILAVQHMPPLFTATLAEKLNRDSKIAVVEGDDGMHVKPGTMYIAPGGKHMIVKGPKGLPRLEILDTAPVKSCKPSVEVLYESIHKLYGSNVLMVMLTGMGNDGADWSETLHDAGAYSLVQDEDTCVVWGMPGAVALKGAADEILPLDRIAERIDRLVR